MRRILVALFALPRLAAGQLPAGIPPTPGHDADLAALGAWIERWLPVVGTVSYSDIDRTGDFLAHASDSITSAGLEGCTLVLHERLVSTVRGETLERRQTVRVPLDQVDTTLVQPRIRRAQMLLTSPNVLVRGQLVLPLRNRSRTGFITISSDTAPHDSLAVEHLVPLLFAEVPATRSALAIRRAAAHCSAPGPRSARPVDMGNDGRR